MKDGKWYICDWCGELYHGEPADTVRRLATGWSYGHREHDDYPICEECNAGRKS